LKRRARNPPGRASAGARSGAAALLLWISAAPAAHAQCGDYPGRPVEVVVPFPAGGPTDDVARIMTQAMSRSTGRTFVVVNRAGAGATIGARVVAAAAPDGATILLTTSALAVSPAFYNLAFDPQTDLVPIAEVAKSYFVLEVNASLPARTVPDLVALARARPGRLEIASTGTGTPIHMAAELFKREAGIDIVHVPYSGSATALADLLGGRVAMMFDAPLSSLPFIRAGKLRALAVTAPDRLAELPEVPTTAEAGYAKVDIGSRYWMLAPKNTPRCVVDFLENLARRTNLEPAVQKRIADLGAEAAWAPGESIRDVLRREIPMWRELVERLAIRRQ
jgi:tripartite-type tricarboxylate transporter receptor subunit TctC